MVVVTGRAERYVDVQTVQDHVDACFQASLAGIDLAKCRKPGVPAWEGKGDEEEREREREKGRLSETGRNRKRMEKKIVEFVPERNDGRGNRGDRRVGPIAGNDR